MDSMPKYYSLIQNVVTKAIQELEQQNYGAAKERLIKGQQDAEDAYCGEEMKEA
ncbi:MAG: hypothetical protein HFF84_07100 [Oscillibacter sp.]|nr:hypothetical protein [Oscillibacter sp.]